MQVTFAYIFHVMIKLTLTGLLAQRYMNWITWYGIVQVHCTALSHLHACNILCRYDLHFHDSLLVSDELRLNRNIAPVVPTAGGTTVHKRSTGS